SSHESPTSAISPLCLHDALPISNGRMLAGQAEFFYPFIQLFCFTQLTGTHIRQDIRDANPEFFFVIIEEILFIDAIAFSNQGRLDRKSTRLNSSHVKISYAVFCL